MKKTPSILFCAVFLLVCSVFSLGLLLPGRDYSVGNKEDMPKLWGENGINGEFSDEFEVWFSKNFAFHDKVTDVYADLKMNIFSEGNDQVIVGEDDFLFFADTTSDYLGTSSMSDEEIKATAEALKSMQDKAEANGATFLFVCAPNKNTVYSDKMPQRYVKSSGPTNLDRQYDALDEYLVNYVDLRPVLISSAADQLLYHKRDTHWNGSGAYIAFEEISARLGVAMPNLSGRGPFTTDNFEGDLDALLFPGKTMYDTDITYDFTDLYIYTSAYSTPMDIVITSRSGGEGKLLMFRDSFANALLPYVASTFAEVRFDRATPYRVDYIQSWKPDFVIVEIAERNLGALLGQISTGEN